MSRGMVSFLAGMGAGYIKAKDKALEQERQAKIDARADWEHQRKVDAATKEDAVNAEMATAMNPVATGSLVTDAAGSNAFTKDADAAAMLADMAGAKNDGVMTQHATRVAGTAYTDPAKAAEATKLAMTPDAESQRVQDVYRRNGMRDKAMQEFTANENYKKALEERKTRMETEGVTTALGLLRAGAPEQAMEAFQKSGSIKLPEGSKFVQVDGTDMWTGQPGKIWAIQGSDGKTIVADVGQSVSRYLGLEGMLKLDGEIGKAAREERKIDIQDRLATAREKQVDGMVMRLAGGSGGSGGAGVSFDPYEGFDPKNAQAEATRTVDEMLVNSGKQVNATERARLISEQVFALRDSYAGQNANRHRASAFIGSARGARTPQEIEAVRQQALSQGFTNQQMAELDPRFAVAAPKPAPAPASSPMARFVGRQAAPAYQPEPGSPAAKAAENRARVQADSQKQREQSIQAARSAASAAISAGDIAAGAKVQDMPGFRLLPDAEKVAIRKLVFGR